MSPSTSERKDRTVPLEDDVRQLLRKLMKDAAKDHATIAQSMSPILGRTVTPSMLADFTRNGNGRRQNRFPCAWSKPFAMAIGNDELTRAQLLPKSQRALALGELLLPWALERAQEAIRPATDPQPSAKPQRRSKRRTAYSPKTSLT